MINQQELEAKINDILSRPDKEHGTAEFIIPFGMTGELVDLFLTYQDKLIKDIESKLPKRWERVIDHEAEFCETCSQIVVEEDDSCLCTARNRALDQVRVILEGLRGDSEVPL